MKDSTAGDIWWGPVNKSIQPEQYDALRADLVGALDGQDLFVRDMWAGADPTYRIAVRVVTPSAICAGVGFVLFGTNVTASTPRASRLSNQARALSPAV